MWWLLTRAYANDGESFPELKFPNEREFAMAFRELVFAYRRAAARLPKPEISLDQFREIVKDLPVVERQLLWLCVKGYSAAEIAPDDDETGSDIRDAVKEIADKRLAEVLHGSDERGVHGVGAGADGSGRRRRRRISAYRCGTYNDLVNGQITWRERELCGATHVAIASTASTSLRRIRK